MPIPAPDPAALRSASTLPGAPPLRRFAVLGVPLLLVLGFVAVFAAVAWRRLLPAPEVLVAAVVALAAGSTSAAAEGTVVVQAAGWLEPDPQPLIAAALVDGVVREVLARDGTAVAQGEVLVRLDDRDAALELRAATAGRSQAAARRGRAEADIAVVAARVRVEEARLAELREVAERLAAAGDAVAAGELRQARLRVGTQEAAIAALRAERDGLVATLGGAEADLAAAEVAVERAQLALERSVVRSPADAVVMRLHAAPGLRVGGGEPPTALAELFVPGSLQVRVDVPLADAAKLRVGQPCRIVVEPWPDRTFAGAVSRLVGAADVTRNTLQAKVSIADPAPELRPEMLARVRFLGGGGDAPASSAVALYAPESALRERSGERATAWVVDVHERLERRPLTVGAGRRDGWVEVRAGLGPGDLVALGGIDGLAPGLRVRPVRREER